MKIIKPKKHNPLIRYDSLKNPSDLELYSYLNSFQESLRSFIESLISIPVTDRSFTYKLREKEKLSPLETSDLLQLLPQYLGPEDIDEINRRLIDTHYCNDIKLECCCLSWNMRLMNFQSYQEFKNNKISSNTFSHASRGSIRTIFSYRPTSYRFKFEKSVYNLYLPKSYLSLRTEFVRPSIGENITPLAKNYRNKNLPGYIGEMNPTSQFSHHLITKQEKYPQALALPLPNTNTSSCFPSLSALFKNKMAMKFSDKCFNHFSDVININRHSISHCFPYSQFEFKKNPSLQPNLKDSVIELIPLFLRQTNAYLDSTFNLDPALLPHYYNKDAFRSFLEKVNHPSFETVKTTFTNLLNLMDNPDYMDDSDYDEDLDDHSEFYHSFYSAWSELSQEEVDNIFQSQPLVSSV